MESVGFREYRGAFEEADLSGKKLLGLAPGKLGQKLLLPDEHARLFEMEVAELKARLIREALLLGMTAETSGRYPLPPKPENRQNLCFKPYPSPPIHSKFRIYME